MSAPSNPPMNSLPPSSQTNVNLTEAKVENPRAIQPVYANNAAVLATPHDFRIVFTEIVSDGPATALRVELRASVGLSPTMLKGLFHAVGQTLKNFERTNGEIKWPPPQPKTN